MGHIPMMFFRKRKRPPMLPSLVKFFRKASAVRTGAGSSSPARLQVPEDMYMDPFSRGTAATAEAVSWVGQRSTREEKPVCSRISSEKGPKSDEGIWGFWNRKGG